MICFKCGKQISDNDRFCGYCGADQMAVNVQNRDNVQPQVEQPNNQIQQQMTQQNFSGGYNNANPYYTNQPQPAQQMYSNGYQAGPQPYMAQPQPEPKKKFPIVLIILAIMAAVGLFIGLVLIILVIVIGFGVKKGLDSVSFKDLFGMATESSGLNDLSIDSDDIIAGFDLHEEDFYDEDDNDDSNPGNEDGNRNYETVSDPTFEDFDWYYEYREKQYLDSDVIWLDSSGYRGAWKGFIFYDESARELIKMDIAFTTDSVEATVDWYMMQYQGEEPFLENSEDSNFSGYEWGNGIHVEGPAVIEIDSFWEKDGKQYGAGSITLQDGSVCAIVLVR
ncbi:MAG: zinc ribbon domain-containing protein [Lachnospiraceae bacterium]|nr:zinc ribbon domain-containing protein [Lachnospiraceae bacterium]